MHLCIRLKMDFCSKVVFFFQNSTQIPSLEAFIIIRMYMYMNANSLKYFVYDFFYWERNGNFKQIVSM